MKKQDLLMKFRTATDEYLEQMDIKDKRDLKQSKANARASNKFVKKTRKKLIDDYLASPDAVNKRKRLEGLLLINYASYIVMLESRNTCWGYDYMAFSRRIGEMWEPFCKLPFLYPIKKNISIYQPKSFLEIQDTLQERTNEYINKLMISNGQKKHLLSLYSNIWNYIDSESINMLLDLHIKRNVGNCITYYDIDYKSGFSSNEKGNTNRLLMVAGIYKSLVEKHQNILLVRQNEDQNNHYLKTLENSGLWDTYCGVSTYKKIEQFTGFNLQIWMDNNMDWDNDITPRFRSYLVDHALMKYLNW